MPGTRDAQSTWWDQSTDLVLGSKHPGELRAGWQQGRQPAFAQQGSTVCAPCTACSWPGDALGLVFSTSSRNIHGADIFCRDRGGGLR